MATRRIRRPTTPTSTEEEQPKRRRARTAYVPPEEDTEGEYWDQDESEKTEPEPEPARPKRSHFKAAVGDDGLAVSGGWEEYRKLKDSMPSDFFTPFKVTEDAALIHFLEAKPFASYKEHFLMELPQGKKKSWAHKSNIECALCNIGHKPSPKTLFNFLFIDRAGSDEEPEPEHWVLSASLTVAAQIADFAHGSATKPLDRPDMYYEIKKSGGKNPRIGLQKVKARDVEEDWGIEPFDEDELEEFRKQNWTSDRIQMPTMKELEEIADMVAD